MEQTLKYTLIFSLLLLFEGLFSQEKYNVVWLVAEDQSSQFFPMYGDESITLPALEGLASESIIYDNAHATVPVCAPARSSIILGMYPIAIATHNMRTYNAYKKDNEPSIGIPSYSPVMAKGVIEFPKYLRAKGYYCTNNAKEDYNMKITDGTWDESSREAHWRKKEEGQPFFSIFNFNESHESGIWRFGDKELFVDPKDVEVPPYFPEDSVVRHDLAVNYSNLKRIDDKIGAIIQQLKDDGVYDNTYIFFYGDHGGPLPRHKRSLRETGLKVPLLVKLPKALNQGSSRNEELVSFVDLGPTVLSIVGIDKPENMHGRAFLGSKVVEEERDYLYASSDRYDATLEHSRAVRSRRYKLIRNYRPDLPYAIPVTYREQMPMMKQLRKLSESGKLEGRAALWMRNSKDSIEFFDLVNDPFELNNLANNPYYRSELEHHSSVLDSWQEEHNDPGIYPEKELIMRWDKIRASMVLSAPSVKKQHSSFSARNHNRLGNLVYKLPGEAGWRPYMEELMLPSGTDVKVVHIGLQDSDVLKVE